MENSKPRPLVVFIRYFVPIVVLFGYFLVHFAYLVPTVSGRINLVVSALVTLGWASAWAIIKRENGWRAVMWVVVVSLVQFFVSVFMFWLLLESHGWE